MKKVNQYSNEFKRRVVNEVMLGDESLEHYSRKYRIRGNMTISRWIHKFAAAELSPMAIKRKDSEEMAELALLRRELDDERLRQESYQLMIKIAEEEFPPRLVFPPPPLAALWCCHQGQTSERHPRSKRKT